MAIDGPLRPILVLFFLETYLDLLVGGLINRENDYLFDIPKNWGPGGNLEFGDQFTVILGYVFFFLCLLFPFFMIWILYKRHLRIWMTVSEERSFNTNYECFWEEFKPSLPLFGNYYLLFICRRITLALICYNLWEEQYTMF